MPSAIALARNRRISLSVIGAGCLAFVPQIVAAAAKPDPAAGQTLAQQYCAECHVVVPNGQRGWTDAPAFDAIANRPATTPRALQTFIEQPHMDMVNTGRAPGEAGDIAAYILTLRTP